jgi:iron-sulfur cluster assembly accessory protein
MSVQTFVPVPDIRFTTAAIEHLKKRLASEPGRCGVRVAVKPSGCSGYAYVLDTVESPQASDLSLTLDPSLTVYVDAGSLPMIRGMEVDYVKEGLNRSIQFRNPNVTGECGCGESFTVKPQ